MKNVTLDRTTVLQLYTHRTDGALNAAADCDVLRNHAAIDRGALADQEIGSAQLALNSAEDLSRTIAFDIADDRHTGADARTCRCIRRRLPPRWDLFDDRVLLLHGTPHDFGHICRCVLILLRYFALEHIDPRFPQISLRKDQKLSSRDWARADIKPFTPTRGEPSG